MAHQALQNRHGRRVAPVCKSSEMIDIRPHRTLRIKRINPKNRDDKFEKEMHVYLQYRENGLLGGAMLGNILRQKTNVKKTDVLKPEPVNKPGGTLEHNNIERNKSEIEIPEDQLGWTSTSQLNCFDTKTKSVLPSPSRESMTSHTNSVQSAGGVQLSVTRPSSEYFPMEEIQETETKEDSMSIISPQTHGTNKESKSAKLSRKTKGHRPCSAKSINQAKSVASSDGSDNLRNILDVDFSENALCSHQDSPFKDVTLFFIHGVGGSADVWNAQIEFFGNLGMEVVAPDLIGHGFSPSPDNPRAYHFNEILADIEAIFDKYCKKQNIIIGHSYGCAFAAAVGRRRARRVSKLVLISGGAPIPLAPQSGVFTLPVCMLSCIKPCLFSKFERNAFHNVKDSGLSKHIAFDVPTYVLSHMMNGQDWLDGDELYHQWLSMPTLLLHGKYDKFVSLEEEQAMEKAIYCSKLVVVDNSSHMLMMEAPQFVNKVMYDFIFKEQNMEHERFVDDEISPVMSRSARTTKSARSSKQLA